MKNIHKTILFTFVICLISVIFIVSFQLTTQNSLGISCSYLDPITIDALAFLAASFLVVDGIYRIWEHKNAPLKKQWSRSVRILFGCSIIALHLVQVFYKFF